MNHDEKKRNEPTLVEKAIQTIDGFEKVYKLLQQQVILRGQSRSTLENYIRRIAQISLHFGRVPQQVSDDEINEYLSSLALSSQSPSRSNFKHAVFGLPPAPARIPSRGGVKNKSKDVVPRDAIAR